MIPPNPPATPVEDRERMVRRAWHRAAPYAIVSCAAAAILYVPVLVSCVLVGNVYGDSRAGMGLLFSVWAWGISAFLFLVWILPFYAVWAVAGVAVNTRWGWLWMVPVHMTNLLLVLHFGLVIFSGAAR
jgi:hypothetical protein